MSTKFSETILSDRLQNILAISLRSIYKPLEIILRFFQQISERFTVLLRHEGPPIFKVAVHTNIQRLVDRGRLRGKIFFIKLITALNRRPSLLLLHTLELRREPHLIRLTSSHSSTRCPRESATRPNTQESKYKASKYSPRTFHYIGHYARVPLTHFAQIKSLWTCSPPIVRDHVD